MDLKKQKISIDITQDLKDFVLELAYKKKIYKLGPCIIYILEKYKELLGKGLINE